MKIWSALLAIFCLSFILGLGKFSWLGSMPCHDGDCAPMTETCALHCWSESVVSEIEPMVGVGLVVLAMIVLVLVFRNQIIEFSCRPVFVKPHRDPKIILTTSKRE